MFFKCGAVLPGLAYMQADMVLYTRGAAGWQYKIKSQENKEIRNREDKKLRNFLEGLKWIFMIWLQAEMDY